MIKKIIALIILILLLSFAFAGLVAAEEGGNETSVGTVGDVDNVGSTGDVGSIGDIGSIGEVGSVGDVGSIGDIGSIGDVSSVSDVGSVGDVGSAGDIGDVGDVGDVGTVGDIGSVGDVGNVGDAGYVNNAGDVGDVADVGGTGDIGEIGDCTTLDADEVAESPDQDAAVFIDPYFYDAKKNVYSYTSITAAVNDFANQNGKGLIYVESGTFNEDVFIDGIANLTGLVFKDYYPKEADAPFNPYDSTNWPVINGTVGIYNMPKFTLLGFVINANNATGPALEIENFYSGTLNLSYLKINNSNAITDTNGLNAFSKGKIIVTEVQVTSAGIGGVGAFFGTPGSPLDATLTITNSSFNNSAGTGLFINSSKQVTLTSVSASYNSAVGATILSRGATIKNSVFSNNTEYGFVYAPVERNKNGTGNLVLENVQLNGNTERGLHALVYGNVTLKNVGAANNGEFGASIDTYDGGSNPGSGNIVISNSSFDRNGRGTETYGLIIEEAKGSVTLTSVSACYNGYPKSSGGARVVNTSSPAKSPITITDSVFDSNWDSGLYVQSMGTITLKDVSASDNVNLPGKYGACLNNSFSGSKGDIKLLNSKGKSNNISNNTRDGLYIASRGNIELNHTFVNNNGDGYGAYIDNTIGGAVKNISIKFGGFSNNNHGGLSIRSYGKVTATLTDADLSGNRGPAIHILAQTNSAQVTLDGGSYIGNSSLYNNAAIEIHSGGPVLVRNVKVINTGTDAQGIYINNTYTVGQPGVTITATRKGWVNEFSNNSGTGIEVESQGSITVNNTEANNNGEYGAKLTNSYPGYQGAVNITNSAFNGNTENGLYVTSLGQLTLSNTTGNNNGWGGAQLNNVNFFTSPKNVTVSNSSFSGNAFGKGLQVQSTGDIKLSNVNAENNYDEGLRLTNNYSGFKGSVVVTGTGNSICRFNGNGHVGVTIEAGGLVTLSGIEANNNGRRTAGYGISIGNIYAGTPGGKISVSNTSVLRNGKIGENTSYGLYIDTESQTALSNIHANKNLGTGIHADTNSGSKLNVTINRIVACDNVNNGLQIFTKGNITGREIVASGNISNGAYFSTNSDDQSYGTVTLSSKNQFNNNGASGLYIYINEYGNTNLTDITAERNLQGIRTFATHATNAGKVTIKKANTNFNLNEGINCQTRNKVLLDTINALNNGGVDNRDGVYIRQYSTTAPVEILNSNLHGNTGNGLEVHTAGALGLVKVTKTNYYGNNANNVGTHPNIYIHN